MTEPPRPNQQPANRGARLHPVLRVALYLAGFVIVISAVQTPVAILWLLLRLPEAGDVEGLAREAQTAMLSLTWLLPLMLLQLAGIWALTYAFRHWIDRKPFLDLELRPERGWLAETMVGVALGVVAMTIILVLQAVVGVVDIGLSGLSAPVILLRFAGYAVSYAAVAVAEELMFRGYVLQTLEEWPGRAGAILGSSLLFAIFHSFNPNVTLLSLVHLFAAGLVFAFAYTVTRRLWLPIGLHFSWNFFQGPVSGFPVSGVPPEGLLAVESHGPGWFTGAAFGPEGGIVGLIGIVIVAAGIWWYSRRREPGDLQA